MNLKLIIFDMDGVILDSERVANLAWFEVSKKYNLGLTLESLREIKGGTTTRTKGLLSERVGVELAEKIMKEKREIQLDIIKNEGGIKLKKGVVELLEYIKEKKLKCAVATSTLITITTAKTIITAKTTAITITTVITIKTTAH